ERDGDRDRRGRAVEQQIADLAEEAGGPEHVAVVEIGHVADGVSGGKRAELELDVLVRRVLELELRFGCGIAAIALAKPADGVDREFLLAFEPDAGAFGEAEDVLGLDLVELQGCALLRANRGGAAETEQTCRTGYRSTDSPRVLAPHRPHLIVRATQCARTLCRDAARF